MGCVQQLIIKPSYAMDAKYSMLMGSAYIALCVEFGCPKVCTIQIVVYVYTRQLNVIVP